MPEVHRLTLSTSSAVSFDTLRRAVDAKDHWRMRTSSEGAAGSFAIEKPVSYTLLRGWSMTTVHRIIGHLERIDDHTTRLVFRIDTDWGVPLFHAGLHTGILLIMTFLIGMVVFSPMMPHSGVSFVLVGVLGLTTVVYAAYAYRRYQAHGTELYQFMIDVAQHLDHGEPMVSR
jgi:uncharacterized membrane protein